MEKKLYYTMSGCLLSLINIVLIETRFNIAGIAFGVLGAIFLVKALLVKKD